MINLERIIKLLFSDIPSSMVLSGEVNANSITRDVFLQNTFPKATHYSEDELENMWSYYREVTDEELQNKPDIFEPGISVFGILFHYSREILVMYNNQIMCTYTGLMEWRNITLNVSQDLLVCAYLSSCFSEEQIKAIGLSWPIVIGQNNHDLNQLIHRGIAENHFHLYGSAPIFHLSWISMMNFRDSILNTGLVLDSFDRNHRMHRLDLGAYSREDSLVTQYHQALFIRLFLFARIMDYPINIGEYSEKESLDRIKTENLPETEFNDLLTRHWARTLSNLLELLKDPYKMDEQMSNLKGTIEGFQNEFGAEAIHHELNVDYAILGLKGKNIKRTDVTAAFMGERYFLYLMLNKIYRQENIMDTNIMMNLFYAYLLIKENFRKELVQVNNKVGFKNFLVYDRRKKKLIADPLLVKNLPRYAVKQCVLDPDISSIEIRVSPGDTWLENRDYFELLDKVIGIEARSKYYYCMHFIKEPDLTKYDSQFVLCRHHDLRQKLDRQARALIELRENAPECAARILGIDAANSEIVCRPEVFAPIFGRLRRHVWEADDGLFQRKLPQLRVTYHVGEDFLDLADGLRAIDEAVNFLEMDCGDRLGHALALGIDVEEWYASKDYKILLSLQDYLDNIAWIYNQLIRFRIQGMDVLKDYLLKKFQIFFQEIYLSNMDPDFITQIHQAHSRVNPTIFSGSTIFNITMYYNAWMLRQDEPSLYKHGYYQKKDDMMLQDYAKKYRFMPKEINIRKISDVALLYYYYHFDNNVRKTGNRRQEFSVNKMYVSAVKAIQKEMRKDIARRGIAIETNPSSNYLIGTFKDYKKHPIFTFYNQGLCGFNPNGDEPQISVSINTDDMGIFSTSLQNEYALIARALEQIEDNKGIPLYTKQQIYKWLEDVRRMGQDMSFSNLGSRTELKYDIDEELEKLEY